MSISRIDHSPGRGSGSPCRVERKPVNVTGTVASQMITPLATTHGVDPNASAMRPATAIASPTYPTRERPDGHGPARWHLPGRASLSPGRRVGLPAAGLEQFFRP